MTPTPTPTPTATRAAAPTRVPVPDLSVRLSPVGNSSPTSGESFDLDASVMNRGSGTSETSTLTYYSSTDSITSSGDTDVGSVQIDMLERSASSKVSITVTAPSTPRKYYYKACVKYVSGESFTTIKCSNAVIVRVQPLPFDLVIDTAMLGDGELIGGETFTLNVKVRNKGTGTSGTTTLTYYRSADSTIGIDDTEVGAVQIGALDAEASSNQSVDLKAFYTPGTYHYGACVDRVIGESDFLNNCSRDAVVSVLATQTAIDEQLLNSRSPTPRAMGHAYWNWPRDYSSDEVEVRVTIHNNIELRRGRGLYLIGCTALSIAGNTLYFGLQTDVKIPGRGGQGKGAIFSRWNERDLSYSRVPADGWTESGGYEGQFISVRGRYEWGAGEYILRVRAEETDKHGRWFGFHVEDSSGSEQWIGSLRFPLKNSTAQIEGTCISAVEVYGGRTVRPSQIPYWRVTVDSPVGDHLPASLIDAYYPGDVESLRNALITVGRTDVTFEIGLDYIASWKLQGAIDSSRNPVGLDILGEGKRRWVKADEGGYFQAVMGPGTYVLRLYEFVGSNWREVGWYDGDGGVTNDSKKAHRLTVDGADIEGIEIRLP